MSDIRSLIRKLTCLDIGSEKKIYQCGSISFEASNDEVGRIGVRLVEYIQQKQDTNLTDYLENVSDDIQICEGVNQNTWSVDKLADSLGIDFF